MTEQRVLEQTVMVFGERTKPELRVTKRSLLAKEYIFMNDFRLPTTISG